MDRGRVGFAGVVNTDRCIGVVIESSLVTAAESLSAGLQPGVAHALLIGDEGHKFFRARAISSCVSRKSVRARTQGGPAVFFWDDKPKDLCTFLKTKTARLALS